jgi:translation elongation factor EF-4
VANFYLAWEQGLTLVPVVNKVYGGQANAVLSCFGAAESCSSCCFTDVYSFSQVFCSMIVQLLSSILFLIK